MSYKFIIQMMSRSGAVLRVLLLCKLIGLVCSSFYSYSACNSTSYLNTANLQCTQCSNNQTANTYQTIPIICQCAIGYVVGDNNICSQINGNTCGTNSTFYELYTITGDVSSSVTNATACSSCASLLNRNGTGCTACGTGMTYSPTQGCICSNGSSFTLTDLGCFATTSVSSSSSNYYRQLNYLIPACATFSDYLSCSQLSNLCAYSQANMNTPECSFFTTNSLTNFLYANFSGFSLTVSNALSLSLKLISYLPTGNYLGEKTLQLGDIMRCGTPPNTDIPFTLGSNFQTSCTYDFNNLVTLMQSKNYKGKLYQILIQGDGGTYYDVPVSMPGSSQTIKRFFLEDSYTSANSINVLSSFTLSFTLDSSGKLTLPQFTPTYTSLSTQAGTGIVSSSSILTLSYSVVYLSSLTSFWTGAIASFITISIVALIHAGIKTYIGYRNRKSPLLFFLNFMGTYSLWLFYYLLFMSGYWFLFTKTTSSPFLFVPSTNTTFYGAFYALVAVMVVFRLVWAMIDKSDKLNTEVFLINWERDQLKNSWRQIFIVSSLANFYTHRTVSLFWMLAIVLFFMNGVGWEKLAAQTTSTDPSTIFYSLTPQNRLLLYFLGCAVFIAVGVIFKILRRLSVLAWPYPFEDFVDYCSVTNISFLFVKRRAPHAFYLHASMPDRTEVTYKKINQAIRRGLQKNRSITNELPSLDSLKLYSVYLSREIEEKHTQMLKKIEDQEHSRRIKYSKQNSKKHKSNYRQEFIENRLKPHLQTMAGSENDSRRKSMLQNFCGIPPIDLREEAALRRNSAVFFDDQLQLVNEVFPNGNEFEQIHTLIVIFLGWTTITNSCPIAAFLTYFLDEYVIKAWISYSCRVNLQQMTKVKRGFMM